MFAGLVAAAPRPAAAQRGNDADGASASLEVAAAPECASRAGVMARVGTRSTRIKFVAPDAATSTLRVTVAGPRGAVAGELTVVRPGGKHFVRRIVAPTCAEAADALALIIAITLDPTHTITEAAPTASSTDAGPGSGRGSAPAASPTRAAPTEPAAASPSALRLPPPPPSLPAVVAKEHAPTELPPPPGRSWVAAGVGAHAITGPAPQVMPGIAVHVSAGIDRASIWSPAARLAVAHARVGGLVEAGGSTADFTLTGGTVDACPLALRVARFAARACAAAGAARLTAHGGNTYSPRSRQRPFVAVGASLIAALSLGRRLQIEARVAGAAPLIRDSYQFTPEVFYRVASVTLELDLGLSIRFP